MHLLVLSSASKCVQELVDCSTACVLEDGQLVCNAGCNGGWMWSALTDVESWGGLNTAAAYPYTAMEGSCKRTANVFAPVTSYTCLSGPNSGGPNYADEVAMMDFSWQHGPLRFVLSRQPGGIHPLSAASLALFPLSSLRSPAALRWMQVFSRPTHQVSLFLLSATAPQPSSIWRSTSLAGARTLCLTLTTGRSATLGVHHGVKRAIFASSSAPARAASMPA